MPSTTPGREPFFPPDFPAGAVSAFRALHEGGCFCDPQSLGRRVGGLPREARLQSPGHDVRGICVLTRPPGHTRCPPAR